MKLFSRNKILSDIEIAQSCEMEPITAIAEESGVDEEYLELYGKYKAKVDYRLLRENQRPDGKLILVTAINPTPAGEVRPPLPLVLQTLCAASARMLWLLCVSPPLAPCSV